MTFWEWAKEQGHNAGGTLAGWGFVQPKFGRPQYRYRHDSQDPYTARTEAWNAKLRDLKLPRGYERGAAGRITASIITWQGEPCVIPGQYDAAKLFRVGSVEDAEFRVEHLTTESPNGIEQYRQKLEEWRKQSEDAKAAQEQAELAEAFLRWKLYEAATGLPDRLDTPHGRVPPERLEYLVKRWKDEYDRQLDPEAYWRARAGIGKA